MKKLLFTAFSLSFFLIVSCKKEKCDNVYALNYNEEGSCTYSKSVNINGVGIAAYPSTNTQGNPWPTEDVYVSIIDANFDTLFISSMVPNSTALPITWQVSPVINLDVSIYSSLIFIDMYGSQSGPMEYELVDLYDYTNAGTQSQKYPSTITIEKSGYQFQLNLNWQ